MFVSDGDKNLSQEPDMFESSLHIDAAPDGEDQHNGANYDDRIARVARD